MKRVLLILVVFSSIYQTIWCQSAQSYSDKPVASGDELFLPFHRGEVIKRVEGCSAVIQRVAGAILMNDSLRSPRGFQITCYGEENYLSVALDPYVMNEGNVETRPGAALDIYFNDITRMFHQSIAPDIYFAPSVKERFMGYDIYDNGAYEVTVIKKDPAPLFLPVSREEYLRALLAKEEQKQEAERSAVNQEQSQKEMEDAYQYLLKTDKKAAEEFKAAMDEYAAELRESEGSPDMVSLLKSELDSMTPEERARQAYYYVGAMDGGVNFSGLADSSMEYADPLVRPNERFTGKNAQTVNLVVIRWTLGSVPENKSLPRLYPYSQEGGYALTDNRLLDLYNDKKVWNRIIELVK